MDEISSELVVNFTKICIQRFFGNLLLKITDFGLSKHYDSIDVLETFVGTPVYMAPEVISLSGGQMDAHSYTEKSDCWSLGVVLYILLFKLES